VNTTTTLTAFVVATVDFSSGRYDWYYRLLSVGSTAANDYNNTSYSAVILHQPNTNNIGGYRNGIQNYVTVTTNTSFILGQQYSGSTAQLYLNGTASSSVSSSGTFNTSSYGIGRDVGNTDGGGSYAYWPGSISEVILYNTSLTTTQRQQVEGYLAWKWGLVANLPTGHPYKTPPIAPFPSGVVTRFVQRTWLPTLISGCSLWLDGADPAGTGIVPSNGAALATWADKSGSSRSATQSNSVLRPTYTSRYINFSGARYFNMTDAFNMLSSVGRFYTFFLVERRGSANNTQFPIAGGGSSENNAGILIGYNTNTVFRQTTASIADLDVTVPGWANPDPTRMWSGGYSGSIRDTYLNGSLAGTQAYSTAVAGWTQPVIGFLPYFNINSYYTGQINEILFYNSYLTTNQRQQVEGYLAWKWGLQTSLPANYPYKLVPPPPP
jgi:hypothetical protein